MQTVLYKYLALYKNLNIPGIGNFVVKQTAPQLKFTDKQIEPPQSKLLSRRWCILPTITFIVFYHVNGT